MICTWVLHGVLTRGQRAQHAREMGSDPDREPPFFFCKPADAVVAAQGSGLVLPFPSATANLHYEVEQARGVSAVLRSSCAGR